MTSAEFLEGVAGELATYGAALESAAGSFRGSLDGATNGVCSVAGGWSGPRPSALQGAVDAVLGELRTVPAAIESAQTTVRRWQMSATVFATSMAVAEARVDWLRGELSMPVADPEARTQLWSAVGAVQEIDASWKQVCRSFAAELDPSIAVIEAANATGFAGSPSGFGPNTGARDDLGTVVSALLDVHPAARTDAVSAVVAAWVGSPDTLQLLIAVLEEAQRRDEASWNAIVESEGLPEGGTWWSNTDVEARWNVDGTEGGWYLTQMAHNAVGDDVIRAVSAFGAPGAVEGDSQGRHTTDILLPVTVQMAIGARVPYMIAEVKPWGGDVPGGKEPAPDR